MVSKALDRSKYTPIVVSWFSTAFAILSTSCMIAIPGGGGHWPRKGVWGCAAVMTPFFQATRRSLAYQFTIIAPLLCPPFSNFRKNFQPCFGQNFSSQDANFPNFRSLDPSFFKENPLPRPYFWKPVWHTPTKKKVEFPPPGCHRGGMMCPKAISILLILFWPLFFLTIGYASFNAKNKTKQNKHTHKKNKNKNKSNRPRRFLANNIKKYFCRHFKTGNLFFFFLSFFFFFFFNVIPVM